VSKVLATPESHKGDFKTNKALLSTRGHLKAPELTAHGRTYDIQNAALVLLSSVSQ
jgi:hypothetical protein